MLNNKPVMFGVLVIVSMVLCYMKATGFISLLTFPVFALVNANNWQWVFIILPACIAWNNAKTTK